MKFFTWRRLTVRGCRWCHHPATGWRARRSRSYGGVGRTRWRWRTRRRRWWWARWWWWWSMWWWFWWGWRWAADELDDWRRRPRPADWEAARNERRMPLLVDRTCWCTGTLNTGMLSRWSGSTIYSGQEVGNLPMGFWRGNLIDGFVPLSVNMSLV